MNLLGRDLVVEATITVDREKHVRCAISTLDEDAPVKVVVEGFLAGAKRLAGEAERLAEQHGMAVTVSPEGEVTVG